MNFIKLGKRYINLDAIASVVPRKKGLGYTVNFIGGTQMDICEMDMADIRRTLEMASTRKIIVDETDSSLEDITGPALAEMFERYHNKGATHE